MIGKLLMIGLRIRWRALTGSKWGIAGIFAALFGIIVAALYAFIFAYLLNEPQQLPAGFSDLRSVLLQLIVAALCIGFIGRNFVPSVREKISPVPVTAPVSAGQRVLGQFVLDLTSPAFLIGLTFLSCFSMLLDVLTAAEAVLLWGAFLTFWMAGHVSLTLVHHRLFSGWLYFPAALFVLPFLLPVKAYYAHAGLVLLSAAYLWLLEYYSVPRQAHTSRARRPEVGRVFQLMSIRDPKMRLLLLLSLLIKLGLGGFMLMIARSSSDGTGAGATQFLYEAFLLGPMVVLNYFLANLWGLNPALWLRLHAGGAGAGRYFRTFWAVTRGPLLVELMLGLLCYSMLPQPVSALGIGLALLSFPLLLVTAFLASIWWPKKIDASVSFARGNSVALPSSLLIVATVLLVFLVRLHPLFAVGLLLLALLQLQAWRYTQQHYARRSPAIYEKLAK